MVFPKATIPNPAFGEWAVTRTTTGTVCHAGLNMSGECSGYLLAGPWAPTVPPPDTLVETHEYRLRTALS